MYAEAHDERRRDLEAVLKRVGWVVAAWIQNGVPEWETVRRALAGEPPPPPPGPAELLARAKRMNKFVRGTLWVKGDPDGR